MCNAQDDPQMTVTGLRTIQVAEAVGTVLAHDITEIRKDEFKGRAFKKGHVVREEDVRHLQGRAHEPAQAGGTTSTCSRSSGLTVLPIVCVATWV